MKKSNTWKYVPGWISVELDIDEKGNVFDISSEKGYESEEFASLKSYVENDGSEMVVNFYSSGFYEPMSMYGGPDRLGNPEYLFDERTLDHVMVGKQRLPDEIAEKVFELYRSEIEAADVEIVEDTYED